MKTKKRVAAGLDLDQAVKRSAEEVYGEEKRASMLMKVPAIREGLGLDDPEARETYNHVLFDDYRKIKSGQFPDYIERAREGSDPIQFAKLCMEYEKHKENKLGDAFITKTERHLVDEDIYRGRSVEDILYHAKHGKFPEENTIDADPDTNSIN